MTNTKFSDVYDRMRASFTDFDMSKLTELESNDILYDFFQIGISHFYLCIKNLQDINATLKEFNFELSPIELDILSNYATIAFINANYVNTPTLIKTHLTTKDNNAFSQANHLSKLLDLKTQLIYENEKLVSKYGTLFYIKNKAKTIKSLVGEKDE